MVPTDRSTKHIQTRAHTHTQMENHSISKTYNRGIVFNQDKHNNGDLIAHK